jgi:hypothetical protein
MKIDPVEEWRRLTEHYREMGDEELYELEADFAGLTETAQQVLRDELKLRGLDLPRAASAQANSAARQEARQWDLVQDTPQAVEDSGDSEEADEDAVDGAPREFTWKTVLCECNEASEAWQIREVLRRAGIDSWVEGRSRDLSYPRVVVAADQLEQAREIAARPIPQEIIDEFNAPPEEYKPPVCPKCGAEDPVLESADPVNSWLCESCGEQWSDPAEAADVTA